MMHSTPLHWSDNCSGNLGVREVVFKCFVGSETVVGRTQRMDKREQLRIKAQVKGTKSDLSAEIQDLSCLPQSLLLESDSETVLWLRGA